MRHRIEPKSRVRLSKIDPADTGALSSSEDAKEEFDALRQEIADLQRVLYADSSKAVLVVLQATDAGGKDGVIRHVFSAANPQGCRVTSFKAPCPEELGHDFLWRVHHEVPRYGTIGVFNRSHYEDVLIVRVRSLVPKTVWKQRYAQINTFEKYLHENGVVILKFFLHISRKEQEERFMKRLLNPEKNWKFNAADLAEREKWDEYMLAYEEAISRCSTPWAPWFVIPADHKWYRNIAVARVLVETLRGMSLRFPEAADEVRVLVKEAKKDNSLPEPVEKPDAPPGAKSGKKSKEKMKGNSKGKIGGTSKGKSDGKSEGKSEEAKAESKAKRK